MPNLSQQQIDLLVTNHIKIDGIRGTWCKVGSAFRNGIIYYLLEHEQHPITTFNIVVDEKYNIIVDNVYNGFDDLDNCI